MMLSLLAYLILAMTPKPAVAVGSWEKLYDVPKDQWVIAVWLAKDGSWRASLPRSILVGDAQNVRSTDVGTDGVMAFGEDSSGTILGVGVHESIWQEGASGFTLSHDRHGPRPQEHAARWNVLRGLGYFDPAHPDRLMAYGDADFSVWRGLDGVWHADEHHRVSERAVDGPPIVPPKGCHVEIWDWLDQTEGFVQCREKQTYLFKDSALAASLGPMPKACRKGMTKPTRSVDRVFTSCGFPHGQLWQLFLNEHRWEVVPGISDVGPVHARNGCVLVGAGRAIYRKCESR